jgi:exopolysaccharide biosynthesis predicted pyruvyltransferase EpsI
MTPEAAPFPSPTLPPDVAQRLLVEMNSAFDELSFLLKSVRDRDFTHAESIQHMRIVRRIAVVSSALHGHITSALTNVERIWLAAHGVLLD